VRLGEPGASAGQPCLQERDCHCLLSSEPPWSCLLSLFLEGTNAICAIPVLPLNVLLFVPGGGDVKIESQKLNFKEKAQAKVGSLDNVGHLRAGGTVKVVSGPPVHS